MLSLTYLSTAVDPFEPGDLEALLAHSRMRNQDADVTGMLLYAGGHFVQTLEGPDDEVDRKFATIEADPRHRDVIVALREEVADRTFPDWSMGFEQLSAEEMADVPGFNDYLDPDSELYRGTARLGRAGVFHRVFRDNMR